MQLVAKSDLSTGNPSYCSYVLKSNDLMFVFSAPYASSTDPVAQRELRNAQPHPGVTGAAMRDFCDKHGFGVRAVGVLVDDAEVAYEQSVANGARGVLPPYILTDDAAVTTSTSAASDGGSGGEGYYQKMSEVELYGDVVLRYVSHHHAGGAASGGTAAVDGGGNVRSESVFLPRYEVRLYKFANPVHP
jgi:4-hydroxyphenylpyruvate dioxygenase